MLAEFNAATVVIGACGTCCSVCQMYTSGACAGCSPGDAWPVDKVVESTCSILHCATAKHVPFCPRDCAEYPCVLYQRGMPICEKQTASTVQLTSDMAPPAFSLIGLRRPETMCESALIRQRPSLHIFCLGPLRVYRNEQIITEAEWGQTKGPTQKIKALFAYLLAKGARGATKDEIVELLWGHQPITDKVDMRLHATLYYLRRALEPDLSPRAKSQYIIFHDGYYRLAPSGGYWIDVAAFEAYYQHALYLDKQEHKDAAARYWKLAEALYQGDYMSGLAPVYTEDYVECCQSQRYRLKDMYRIVLLNLAHYHFQHHQDRLSLAYAQKALVEDRGCEEAHCLIMMLMHHAGQRDGLIHQYHLCKQALSEAEDRAPSPETNQLYQRLLHTI